MYSTLKTCRLCLGAFFSESILLKDTPPANELYPSREDALAADRFPLEVVMCAECKHVQLKHIINPKRLFDNYVYKSGTSDFFRSHFDQLAEYISKNYEIQSYILEVGSNDGVLLEALNKRGIKNIGIEPSKFLADECLTKGQVVYNSYLDTETIENIISTHGLASIVLGNNVFAHIQDLKGAFSSIYKVLDTKGIFIFEVAHLKFILTDGVFDTIYHEHMSYHTAISLEKFSKTCGLKLVKIENVSTHGGSLRFFMSKDQNFSVHSSVQQTIDEEISLGLNNPKTLELIQMNITKTKNLVNEIISEVCKKPKQILIGYGAPAKVVTFLTQMELEELDLLGIIDDNLDKQQKYLPGSGFKVTSAEQIQKLLFDSRVAAMSGSTCLIFPWNLKKEIIYKLRGIMPDSSNALLFFPKVEMVEI